MIQTVTTMMMMLYHPQPSHGCGRPTAAHRTVCCLQHVYGPAASHAGGARRQDVGGGRAVAVWCAAPTHEGQDRLACLDRRRTVFAVMLLGARAERLALLPQLPEELWLYTFSFLKHAETPTRVEYSFGYNNYEIDIQNSACC